MRIQERANDFDTNATSLGVGSSVFVLPQTTDTSLNDQDRLFLAQASASNTAEIAKGQLATTNSDSAATRIFGQWMVTDHLAVGSILNAIASQAGFTGPVAPDQQQAQQQQTLRSQSGTAFDQAYAQEQVTDHQQALALFQQEADNGQNAVLKALAQQSLPVLRQHLAGAQQLAAGSGSASDDNGSGNGGSGNDDTSSTSGSSDPQTTAPVSASDPARMPGGATQPPAGLSGSPSQQDIGFVQFAAQSGLVKAQEGQLAIANSSDLAVSEFGRWMVTDHTANNAVLQDLAQQQGIAVPTTPRADQQSEFVQLQSLPPDAFAAAYARAQVTDHAATLIQFIREATTGHDAAIRTFAQDTIPVLAQHLGAAISLELAQLGDSPLAHFSTGNLTQTLLGTTDASSGQGGGQQSTTDALSSQMAGAMAQLDTSQMPAMPGMAS